MQKSWIGRPGTWVELVSWLSKPCVGHLSRRAANVNRRKYCSIYQSVVQSTIFKLVLDVRASYKGKNELKRGCI